MTTATTATHAPGAKKSTSGEPEPVVIDLNMVVEPEQEQAAQRHACAERAENAPDPLAGLGLAVAHNRLWAVGKRLRVRFLDARAYADSEARINAVMAAAQEWTRYANLALALSDDVDAELRVAFSPLEGCWSYIGTDAKTRQNHQPTINLSVMGGRVVPPDYARYVLHEFGHAIGCVHEHATPVAGIKWNKPVVYDYYWRNFGWDKEKIELNVFHVFAQASSNHVLGRNGPIEIDCTSVMDKDSIMVYPIPREHTLDGYSVAWRGTLSTLDKEFIKLVYP